ncbi:MAG: efflux RND transporter periplasmic adaptor subunit [Lachnospiraceae bacterium]|nr:efflux RND transporter periplasmic adaptor subunit [Lachnospiraceae bacterium]
MEGKETAMMRKITVLISVVALLVCTTGCTAKEEAVLMDPSINVTTVKAYVGSQETEGNYIGVIENTDSVSVVPLVSGTVEEVNYEVGDTVSSGSVLCRFDATTAEQNLQNAKTGLKSAQASYASAQASYTNTIASTAQNIIIQHNYDDYNRSMNIHNQENSLCQADYSIENYENAVKDAKDNLEDAEDDYDKAKKSGDSEAISAAKSKKETAEDTLEKAEQNLKNAEFNYNGQAISLAQSKGQQEQLNGIVYAGQQVVAAAGMDVSKKSVDSAAVGIDSAKNSIEAAEYQLSLYTITAPISGVIERVDVDENNYFGSGQVSFVISNPNSRRAVFHVPDNVAAELEVGREVEIISNGKEYVGDISEIGVAVDDTGLFQIKAEIPDAPELADGIYIKLSTVIHKSENNIVIPSDAVYFEDNQAYVYVEENGMAVKKNVEFDIYGEEETTILNGLSDGDNIIATWSGSLKDGAPVKVTNRKDPNTKASLNIEALNAGSSEFND